MPDFMMMNKGKLLAQHVLANGLTLEFWDHSRPVAGDRWFVALETRIVVPVQEGNLPPELIPLSEQVARALGVEIIFSQREERNFIAAAEFTAVLQDMQERVLKLAPSYFGHKDFAARFIRKTYGAYQERQDRQTANPGGSEP